MIYGVESKRKEKGEWLVFVLLFLSEWGMRV